MKRHVAKPALSWDFLERRQLLSAAPAIALATAASDAYIYGLAPVLEYYTERINTDVVSPNSTGQAQINKFANQATFPDTQLHDDRPAPTPIRSFPPPGSICPKARSC